MTWGGSECSSAGCHHTEERLYTLQWCVCVRMWGRRELLLQVAIDFEAVVARIGHHDVSVRGERQPLWAVQRVC